MNHKGTMLYAPITGNLKRLEDVEDEVFARKLLGEGFAITPLNGDVYAPANGRIVVLQKSKHAIGLKVNDEVEVLIHIGIDTVNLCGEAFASYIKEGDIVKKGDKLISFDLEFLKTKGYITDVITIIIDHENINNVKLLCDKGSVMSGSMIAHID